MLKNKIYFNHKFYIYNKYQNIIKYTKISKYNFIDLRITTNIIIYKIINYL